jgi:hypothetical protein
MKPSRSNRPYSDTVYQGTVNPYANGISEKWKCIGNRFNVRTIFKINIPSVEHWWKLDRLEMPSRRSSVCTASHVIVSDVTSVKQADL